MPLDMRATATRGTGAPTSQSRRRRPTYPGGFVDNRSVREIAEDLHHRIEQFARAALMSEAEAAAHPGLAMAVEGTGILTRHSLDELIARAKLAVGPVAGRRRKD